MMDLQNRSRLLTGYCTNDIIRFTSRIIWLKSLATFMINFEATSIIKFDLSLTTFLVNFGIRSDQGKLAIPMILAAAIIINSVKKNKMLKL